MQTKKSHPGIEIIFLIFTYELYFLILLVLDLVFALGTTYLIIEILNNPCDLYTYQKSDPEETR